MWTPYVYWSLPSAKAELLITTAELQKSGSSEPAATVGCNLNVLQHPDMSLLSLKVGASRRGADMVAENFIRYGGAVNLVAVFKAANFSQKLFCMEWK